mmetsp:Transcript_62408/g.110023  ORF Transcript_62408/g.110023 Transcript_62408/m.110023 type:complete len:219 (+) Transcript_62408:485-1141(+)
MATLIKAPALGKATKATRAMHRLRRSIPTSRPRPGAVLALTERIPRHMVLILRTPLREAPRPPSSIARMRLRTTPHPPPLGSSGLVVETAPPVAIPTMHHRPCRPARTPILSRRHSRTTRHQHLLVRPLLLPRLHRQRRRTTVLRVVGCSGDYVRVFWLGGIPMLTTPMTISARAWRLYLTKRPVGGNSLERRTPPPVRPLCLPPRARSAVAAAATVA